eukprot:2671392-Amphidinium_carterae.3
MEPLELDHLHFDGLQQVVADDLFILSASTSEDTPKQIKTELVDQSITIPLTDIRASQGAIREKWIQASKKEIETLISSKTIAATALQERDALKLKCKKIGWQYSELPCKGVFTIKPDKHKARICGCGNFEQDTYGTTATNEMDSCIMRYLLSWHDSKCASVAAGTPEDQQTLSSLDYTGAFLNADLP